MPRLKAKDLAAAGDQAPGGCPHRAVALIARKAPWRRVR